VQPIASRVAVGKNEASPVVVFSADVDHFEPYLKEEGDKVDRMRRRANAVVDTIGVSHVRLVIRRVEVHTVPTSREEYLGPETIWAISVGESWSLWYRGIEVDADCGLASVVVIVRGRDGTYQSQLMA
jgi:hypothetical protein